VDGDESNDAVRRSSGRGRAFDGTSKVVEMIKEDKPVYKKAAQSG
jgi:molybdopterin synthase catalytic subunit